MKWLRLYDDLLDDPKVQKLPPVLFKGWINLLCLASKGDVRGVLPSLEDIAFRLRMSEEDAEKTLMELKTRGLIDETELGDMPHQWASRQPESDDISRRVAEHRARKKGALQVTLPVTLPVQECNVIDVDKIREDTEKSREERESNAAPTHEAPVLRVSSSQSVSVPKTLDTPEPPAKPPTPTPKSLQEVKSYFRLIGGTDSQATTFWNHFEGIGWLSGGNKIVDWWASARKWRQRDEIPAPQTAQGGSRASPAQPMVPRETEREAVERLLVAQIQGGGT